MPSEQAVAVDVPEVATAPQIKLCATCHNPLTELPEFLSPDLCLSGPVCSACADRARLRERLVLNEIAPRLRRQSTLAPMVEEPTEYTETSHPPPTVTTPPAERTDLTLAIPHSFESHTLSSPDSPPPRDRRDSQPKRQAVSRPDPFSDVTRLRLNNTRQDCLYPGATFAGIQKSGRNSYNVAVTIVNVDFPGSTLCGYLTIENLTEDHPQLTTYFDAEIIGPKYGFLTQSYGASESDDMTHWGRFDPFRAIKSEMRRPGLTIRQKSLTERGFVFMRWKERFLVPEHQVRGIRGASYDGFYYVCVQLGTPADSPSPVHGHHYREPTSPVQSYHHLPHHSHHSHHSHPTPPTRTRTMSSASANSARSGPISPEVHEDFPPLSPVSSTRRHSHSQPHPHSTSPTSPRITRSRDSFSGCGGGRGSFAPRTTATMTGFYFHQNSEPYQQLTLHHQPERTIPTFEFC